MEKQDLHGSDRHGEGDEIEWTAVATAPDQLTAEMWQGVLQEQSIPCVLASRDTISFLGVSATPVRLMVPHEMRSRAQEALAGLLGASPPADIDRSAR